MICQAICQAHSPGAIARNTSVCLIYKYKYQEIQILLPASFINTNINKYKCLYPPHLQIIISIINNSIWELGKVSMVTLLSNNAFPFFFFSSGHTIRTHDGLFSQLCLMSSLLRLHKHFFVTNQEPQLMVGQ